MQQNYIIFKDGNAVDNQTNTWKVAATSGFPTITSGYPAIISSTPGYVIPAPTASPVIGTHYVVGFSNGNSTETASVDGTCDLYSPIPQQTLLLAATVPADIATQAQYDALVLTTVLFDLTAGVYTIDTTTTEPLAFPTIGTAATLNGLVVMPLDITLYPTGLVAFIIREAATFLN